MKSKHCQRWIAVVVLLLGGCAAARQYPASPALLSSQLVEVGRETPVALASPQNVLVLSGGGMNGAYAAGVLKGWTAAGARPSFDVVTGISTGALIAPFAFLGLEYDVELERLYTSMRQENIFRPRLFGLDSLVSSAPLEKQIAAAATPEILQKIAETHRQGRRLYVGTTNLDTKKLVVWDMGAIAVRNTVESRMLFQKVLLASCSVPGLLPPVAIDVEIDGKHFTELHVDGGVTACLFLQPAMIGLAPGCPLPADKNLTIYALIAGKLYQNATPAKRELFSIAGESMNTVLQAKTEGELTQLFLLARYAKANFRVAGIRQDYETAGNSMSFDPRVMRQLFDDGFRVGKDGTAWRSAPPGLENGQASAPRGDTRFATVRGTPTPNSWTPENLTITLDAGNSSNTNKNSPPANNGEPIKQLPAAQFPAANIVR